MLKNVLKIIKKVIFAAILLYAYNIIAAPLNLQIPINVITLTLITVLGVPSLVGLFLMVMLFFS